MSVPPELMQMMSPAMGGEMPMDAMGPSPMGGMPGMIDPNVGPAVQPDGLDEDLPRGEVIDWIGGKPINLNDFEYEIQNLLALEFGRQYYRHFYKDGKKYKLVFDDTERMIQEVE